MRCTWCAYPLDGHKTKFCSRICKDLGRPPRRPSTGPPDPKCRGCQIPLTGTKTAWCSASCREESDHYKQVQHRRYMRRREELIARASAWKKANPEKARLYVERGQAKWRLARYDMTVDEFERMLHEQDGLCKICGRPPESVKGLVVDHCHSTGAIRGLLCLKCNSGLGMFRDDTDVMHRAIDYLAGAI